MSKEKLYELFEMATLDGELSPKSKEIIMKIAAKMGEDLDELELWLEWKMQKKMRYDYREMYSEKSIN